MLTNWRGLWDRNDTTPKDLSWMEGPERPHIPSCRKWEALLYQGSLASSYQGQHSHCTVLSHSCIPATPSQMSLSLHAAKSVSFLRASLRALHL